MTRLVRPIREATHSANDAHPSFNGYIYTRDRQIQALGAQCCPMCPVMTRGRGMESTCFLGNCGRKRFPLYSIICGPSRIPMVDGHTGSAVAWPCAGKAVALRNALFATTVVGAALLQSITVDAAPSPPAPCGTLVRKERLVHCRQPVGSGGRHPPA